MAVTLVGATSAAGASVTAATVTVTVPTGSNGEILLIGVAASSPAAAGSVPAVIVSSSALPTLINNQQTGWCNHALYYRVVQAGDPTSYAFTVSVGSPLTVVCVRYSGVHQSTPIRQWNQLANLDLGSVTTTSQTFPPLDNVAATDLVAAFVSMGVNTQTATISTISTPTGWTSRVTQNGPVSGTTAFPVTARFFDRVAATDTPSVSGSTGSWAAHCVALVDASSPVPDAAGGAITFIAAATAATTATGATSLVVNKPAGVVDGHLMLLVAGQSVGAITYTPPAGWTSTEIGRAAYNYGASNFFTDVVGQVWYKFANSEAASYTIGMSAGGQEAAMAIVAYAGVRNPYPIALHGATNTTDAPGTAGIAPYALPQVKADNLIVTAYLDGADVTTTGFTVTGPTTGGWTQRTQIISTVSDYNAAVTIADKLAAADYPAVTTSVACSHLTFTLALVGASVSVLGGSHLLAL